MRFLFGIAAALAVVSIAACTLQEAGPEDAVSAAPSESEIENGIPLSAPNYEEKHRPQFHFSPPQNWMNDPNGMVYFDGEYHLFYQHHPFDMTWGPMHWGHAISTDLVHWENQPIALYPDDIGHIWSGSAVVDWNNTSGFGDGETPPIVAVYTLHDMEGEKAGRKNPQSQGLAYSLDKARSWTKFDGNPVLASPKDKRDFRDPKVIWDEARGRWSMALAVGDHIEFYASTDLKTWEYQSSFGTNAGAHGGVWECPDLFPIRVEGTGETKWVLLVSISPGAPNGGTGTQYFVGDFDGETFELDPVFKGQLKANEALWIDWGRDNYAGVTWSDIPKEDGRRVFIGWMSNWEYADKVPTAPWRSAMTLPREITLSIIGERYTLKSEPVSEVVNLRVNSAVLEPQLVSSTFPLDFETADAVQKEIVLIFNRQEDGASFGVEFENAVGETYRVGFNSATNEYFSDRRNAGDHSFSDTFAQNIHIAPRAAATDMITMRLFIDAASIELFADDGATVMTEIIFPGAPFSSARIFADNGDVQLESGEFHSLKSIWR